MATQVIYLLGKVKWAKVRTPDEKYNKYSVDLYPNKGSWETFHKSGIQIKVREDTETKEEFIKLSRPHSKIMKNETVVLGPPNVLIKQSEEEGYDTFEGLIGNGSLVNCKVSVYDTRMGKGHTLEAVAVENLIEYNPDTPDYSDGVKMPF